MTTFEKTEQFVLGNYGRFPVAMSRGEGARIWDEAGKEYLDFCTGIAVCSLGHSHPAMVNAITEQAGQLLHCSNLYHIPQQSELAQFIVEQAMDLPGKVFFCNSGAEANDGAVKTARKYHYDQTGTNDRYVIITCQQSFHGRTLGGIAATGQDKVKVGFDPLLPGFIHVPFNDAEALREAVSDKTAAILFEPIQGEGGITAATAEFFQAAAELRDEHGLLLMYDEVQCGFGRTGDWCGWRTILRDSGVVAEPDVVTWAKGMGGGFPIGSFWVSDKCASAMGPGTHGSTFGGAPLASTASLAVLREIESSGYMAKIPQLEAKIKARVADWNYPQIAGIRGVGLMLGFQVNLDALPEGERTPIFLVKKLMEAGLLTVPAGADIVRWLPPLNVAEAEIDEAFEKFETELDQLN